MPRQSLAWRSESVVRRRDFRSSYVEVRSMIRVFGIPASKLQGEAQKHTDDYQCHDQMLGRGLSATGSEMDWPIIRYYLVLWKYTKIDGLQEGHKTQETLIMFHPYLERFPASHPATSGLKESLWFHHVSPVSYACPEDQQKEPHAEIALAAFPSSLINILQNKQNLKTISNILKTACNRELFHLKVTNVDDSLIRYWLYGRPGFGLGLNHQMFSGKKLHGC